MTHARHRRFDSFPERLLRVVRRGLCGLLAGLLAGAVLTAPGIVSPAAAGDDDVWTVTAKTQFMMHSHTSYAFGNPIPPYQSPLSRLDFPIKATWVGLEASRRLGRFSLGLEYLSTLANQESGRFKDSDWEDETTPRLTTFGEASCRLRPSHQLRADLDMETADLLRLPSAISLRPVLGFRWQHLSFLAHDGTQYEYGDTGAVQDTIPLPGDTIGFVQDWYHYFLGLRLGYVWNSPPLLRRIRFNSQMDWGYAVGDNTDRHLLRGSRETREATTGGSWHVLLGVMLGLTEHLDAGVEAEYQNIETTGRHTLQDTGINLRWSHGVRVWSDQSSLSVKLAYSF